MIRNEYGTNICEFYYVVNCVFTVENFFVNFFVSFLENFFAPSSFVVRRSPFLRSSVHSSIRFYFFSVMFYNSTWTTFCLVSTACTNQTQSIWRGSTVLSLLHERRRYPAVGSSSGTVSRGGGERERERERERGMEGGGRELSIVF